jgi:hypothetical protein
MSAEHKRKLRREQTRRYRAKKKDNNYVLRYVPISYSTDRIGLKLARPIPHKNRGIVPHISSGTKWKKPKRRSKR